MTVEDKSNLQQDPYFQIKKGPDFVYFGQIINDKRHGKGILYYQSGRLYEGEWENGLKYGRGLEIFANGSFYDGYYVNGKPEGVGQFSWPNGEVYEGQWMNGQKHGSGIWKGNKGDSYIGEWKSGQADGIGVHTWVNGDRYEGEFRNCMKNGHGYEKFANADTYVGNYENGKPNGVGEYYWVSGAVYKGDFKNGLRHGKGIWQKGTGITDKYDGEWENDKKNGFGVFTWADGSSYEGTFKQDLRDGYGKMHWNDGTIYDGHWRNGIQDGSGQMSIAGQAPVNGIFRGNVLVESEMEGREVKQQYPVQAQRTSGGSPVRQQLTDGMSNKFPGQQHEAKSPMRSQSNGRSSHRSKAQSERVSYEQRHPQNSEKRDIRQYRSREGQIPETGSLKYQKQARRNEEESNEGEQIPEQNFSKNEVDQQSDQKVSPNKQSDIEKQNRHKMYSPKQSALINYQQQQQQMITAQLRELQRQQYSLQLQQIEIQKQQQNMNQPKSNDQSSKQTENDIDQDYESPHKNRSEETEFEKQKKESFFLSNAEPTQTRMPPDLKDNFTQTQYYEYKSNVDKKLQPIFKTDRIFYPKIARLEKQEIAPKKSVPFYRKQFLESFDKAMFEKPPRIQPISTRHPPGENQVPKKKMLKDHLIEKLKPQPKFWMNFQEMKSARQNKSLNYSSKQLIIEQINQQVSISK